MTPGPHADFLEEQVIADAELGRMTMPQSIQGINLADVRCARRFSREQGVKPSGDPLLRAVDDETNNGVNDATQPVTKMTTDSIDLLAAVTLKLGTLTGQGLAL